MARYTVKFGEEFERTLERLSNEKETSKAEILRRALSAYAYLSDEVTKGENKLVLMEDGKLIKEIVFTNM